MPRLSFTLRDVFWLTLVVGMGVGWWVECQRVRALHNLSRSDDWEIKYTLNGVVADREVRRPEGNYHYHFDSRRFGSDQFQMTSPVGQP